MGEAVNMVTAAELQREVAELERIVALVRRREELRSELAARNISWANLPIPPIEIIKIVAGRHGLTAADVTGDDRSGAVVRARQEAMWLLRQQVKPNGEPRFSLSQIGAHFSRDHTTVVHSIGRHESRAALASPAQQEGEGR